MAFSKGKRFNRFGGGRRFGGSNGRGRPKPNLNIMDFIERARQASESAPQPDEIVHGFGDFGLDTQLLTNIERLGFSTPTPIQDQAIPLIMSGKDVLGLANTGTGKTASFLIPLIQKITTQPNKKVLVIAPTRELAIQIDASLRSLKPGFRIWSVLCIGGMSSYRQMQDLRRPHEFVIGTPGRLKDLMNQGVLDLSNVSTVVLDEVDRMMDMGFLPDMRKLLGAIPQERQSLFFSATLSAKLHELASTFMREPVTVSVKTTEITAQVDQSVVKVAEGDKLSRLFELLAKDEFEKVLVFGRTKRGVHRLMFKLRDQGIRAESIHGNKSQGYRQQALDAFRRNRVNVLVATDVAARGLDIADITHVINYDIPETYDDYVHRIGRTGRAGSRGSAVTFVS